MENNKRELDEIIKQSLDAEADKIVVPPKEEIWQRISEHLEQQKIAEHRKGRKFKFLVASVAVVLYIGITPWLFPDQDAKAVGERLVKILQSVFGGETKVEIISRENIPPGSDQPPPPEEEVPVEVIETPKVLVFTSIEKAREKVVFNFREPKHVPPGYTMKEIAYSPTENEPGEVVLRYKSETAEFKIIQRKVTGDFAMSSTVKAEESTSRNVAMNNISGTLTSFKNGVNELEFYYLGISIRVYGHLEEQQIIQIGKSML